MTGFVKLHQKIRDNKADRGPFETTRNGLEHASDSSAIMVNTQPEPVFGSIGQAIAAQFFLSCASQKLHFFEVGFTGEPVDDFGV
jgi:hypothetical protein